MRPSGCPSDESLRAYQRGDVTATELDVIAEHLERCGACLVRLEQFGQDADPVLAALRLTPPPTPDDPTCRATLDRLADSPAVALAGPGSRLGEYRLLEPLGAGGMGRVYRAVHTRLDRAVALKVLRRGHDPQAAARFAREMRAVGRVRHPHIVHATDAGESGGVLFLVMEYVAGCDLARLVKRRGPLRPADACELVRQAALGLQHAHDSGLVHRDVKPSNLMLTADGQVKLLDLGLALLLEEQVTDGPPAPADAPTRPGDAALTSASRAVGTTDYMAPEQRRDAHGVDARADVYGLGATLVYLLTGRPPRPDAAPVASVPAAVLRRLLAAEPAGRYPGAAAVAAALAPLARGCDLPALLRDTPPPPARRRRRIVRLVVPLLAAGLFGTAWLVHHREPPATGCATAPAPGRLPLAPDAARDLQRRWAEHLGVPVVRRNGVGMDMVLIPPGELPLHGGGTALLERPYRIGACEVTVGQFRAFVTATGHRTAAETGHHGGMVTHPGAAPAPEQGAAWHNPGHPSTDEHPVTQVAYPDAEAFCAWLSRTEGATYRPPTIREWRWACKAGSHAPYFFGSAAAELTKYAWTRDNAPDGPRPVGRLRPNAWGLYDMLGNVREWASDRIGPPGRLFRAACGGSVSSDLRQHTVDGIGGFEDWVAAGGVGFRVVCEP